MGTVADAALQEIRESFRATAGAMLVWEAGSLAVVGSYGIRNPDAVSAGTANGMAEMVHGNARVVTTADLDAQTAQALGGAHDCWIAAPMRRDGAPLGLLMATCPDHAQHNANRVLLQQLAQETAVAVENARLFSRVREISIDEERRRLARELHDETGQALTSILLGLKQVEEAKTPEEAHGAAKQLRELIVQTLQSVRRLAVELRPKALDDFGLVPALERLGEAFGEQTEIRVDVQANLDSARLPAEVETALYRIVQEALTNVAKHSGASRVSVVVTRREGLVTAIVEDDGRGFGAGGGEGEGLGLVGMKERVGLLDGRLAIESTEGAGTTLVAEVPIR
jgi:signal transduction histidine kinase